MLAGEAFTGASWRRGLPPGVYEDRAVPARRRTVCLDTLAIIGLAERGPVETPVGLTSWPAFGAAFGAAAPGLQGPVAVRLFFANGGRRCVFVRALDTAGARATRLRLPGLLPAAEATARSVGRWGNRLLLETALVRRTLPLRRAAPGDGWPADALLGPAPRARLGTTLRLAGDPPPLVRHIVDVSAPRGGVVAIVVDPPLAPAPDDGRLAASEELAVRLDIILGETLVERWDDAALHPFHESHLPRLLMRRAAVERFADDIAADPDAPAGSAFVRPDAALADTVLRPSVELLESASPLRFDAARVADADLGDDAAATTSRDDFLRALSPLARWDDAYPVAPVALVTLPDLLHRTAAGDDRPVVAAEGETCFGVCVHVPPTVAQPALPYPLLGAASLTALREAHARLVALTEANGRRVVLLDLPPGLTAGEIVDWRRATASPRAALFAPWLRIADPADPRAAAIEVPPAAAVAGLIATVERMVGVFASPGARTVAAAFALVADPGLPPAGFLHDERVDLIAPTERGLQLMGSRTTALDAEWTHIGTRRLIDWIALQLAIDLAWAPFEPNNAALWRAMTRTAERRLDALLEAGAFAGLRADDSYFVRCGPDTMTQGDLDFGRAVMLVGVAPSVPAEFIVFRLARGGADDPRIEILP